MISPRNSQSNKKHKKVYEKYIPLLTHKQIQQKAKIITKRLSRQQICKQHKLIANMNPKLQIQLAHLLHIQELKNIKLEDLIKIVQKVPYLSWLKNKNMQKEQNQQKNFLYSNFTKQLQSAKRQKQQLYQQKNAQTKPNYHQKNQSTKPQYQQKKQIHNPNKSAAQTYSQASYLKLYYPASQKTIILTGITKIFIQNSVKQFNKSNDSNYSSKKNNNHHTQPCQIVGFNDFWVAVQADSQSTALLFKKFVRSKKKFMDQRKIYTYKQQKKRVRIVMQRQDFYTLLVDSMTEKKNSQFLKRLVNPNTGLFPKMCLRDSRKIHPFQNQQYQISLKKINKILYFPIITHRPQTKQTQSTLDEVFSEDFSKTSEFYESINSMNDLIEKLDIGTQAESMGVGTNMDQSVSTQNLDGSETNINDKFDFQEYNHNKSSSPLKNSKKIIQNTNRKYSDDQQLNQNLNQKKQIKPQSYQYEQEEGQLLQELQFEQKLPKKLDTSSSNQNDKKQISKNKQNHKIDFQNETIKNIEILQKTKQLPQNLSNQHRNMQQQTKKSLLFSVRQPQIPQKFLKLYFATQAQTQSPSLNYTRMKRYQGQYKKKSNNRVKLSIPQQFRQISQQQKNRRFFFQNIQKSMQRKSQRKQYMNDFFY